MDKVFALLDPMNHMITCSGGVSEHEIKAAEEKLGLCFPEAYRRFLSECGILTAGPLRIYGLGVAANGPPSLFWALTVLRTLSPHIPRYLVPIQLLENGQFLCLPCQETGSSAAREQPVVVWHLHAGPEGQNPAPFHPDFAEYLFEQLSQWQWFQNGLERLTWHVNNPEFEWHHQEGGRLPRNHLWRPYRFCVQDVVLGLTVLRHCREFNCLEVDVFLTASIPEYEADSGARALVLLLLSEAYKCGGTMEIRFAEHVEDKRVPRELVLLAEAVDVRLEHVSDGVITPAEARRLYAALTGFPPQLRAHIEALEQAGRLSVPLICYAIHHGLWERAEVEAILLTSPRPGSLLSGQARPEQRHLYLQDLLYGRAAILFGSLDRHLRCRAHPHENGVIHLEDDERPLELDLGGNIYAATYRCPQEDVVIPWVAVPAGNGAASNGTHRLAPGQPFRVLVRARDAADLIANFEADLEQAAKVRQTQADGPVYVLVPQDFEKLPDELRQRLVQNLSEGVGLLVYPQFVSALDDDVAQRLRTSRVMRA